MRSVIRNAVFVAVVLIVCVWSIIPPEKKLRLGKDLRGGVSLVYSVLLTPNDPPDVIAKVIDVLKQRLDPNGLAEISIVQQGQDRLEISAPLPSEKVKRLRAAFDETLHQLERSSLDDSEFERIMRLAGDEREREIARVSAGDTARASKLQAAARAVDAAQAARAELNAAQAALKQAQDSGATPEQLKPLQDAEEQKVAATADAEVAYDAARQSALSARLTEAEMRRTLGLPSVGQSLRDDTTNKWITLPSPQEQAIERIRAQYPDQKAQIDAVLAAHAAYAAERTPLDDSADLKRMLAAAGVLDFRIAINTGEFPRETELRRLLHDRGPRNAGDAQARWFAIDNIANWYDSAQSLQRLRDNPAAYFANRQLVGEEYDGTYYLLMWDVPGARLTRAEGDWGVQAAYQTTDEVGRPAIGFTMNPRGAQLLGDLTGAHVNKPMAILLDDRVYTAPTLNSRISKSGIIQGSFDDAELRYIIRVLAAGSLQAKLSPEPISESQLGPQLGLDNLKRGLYTGVIAFAVVSVFMIVYYFQCGLIAVVALWVNLLFILGIMALNHAAFTLPGIAGVILTFGQAVDSNVLVYERMREEFRRGADMRTSVRLGFSKALASIVDGNVAHLIVCVVLLYVGTQEIKGFAITLAIGILGTLFGALVFSRLVFTVFVDYIGWRKTSMLPMVWPGLQHFLTPHINWIRLRWVWVVVSSVLVVAGLVAAFVRGPQMLDTEFRGGTQVDIVFRQDPATNKRITQTRKDVEERVREIGAKAPAGSDLHVFNDAEILPVNPQSDGVTSDHFQIKTRVAEDKQLLTALVAAFSDLVESQPALKFDGSNADGVRRAPVFKILSDSLGENIDRPNIRDNVNAYVGGAAIVLDNITPAVSKESLQARLDRIRQRSEFSDTLGRKREILVLGGDERAVTSAVIVVRDEGISAFDNEDRWWRDLAEREWRIVSDALGRNTELASVQTFSPAIAQTFVAQAIVAVFLSMVMLTIYVWVRFGAPRWALAATLPVFHDILGIIGLIALAQFLYENPVTGPAARAMGILPFKINLNLIAALLTIAGYSLNDTIIILDRIRENKGKLKYASSHTINDSINQTLSRTLITSGTTLISTVILYFFGGEAVRGFSYAFTLGVFVGTYSSIAISAPLVWSGKDEDDTPTRGPGSGGKAAAAAPPPPPPAVPAGR